MQKGKWRFGSGSLTAWQQGGPTLSGPRECLAQCGSPGVKLPPAGAWEDIMVEGNALSGTVIQALRCAGSDAKGAAELAGYYLVMLALTEGS